MGAMTPAGNSVNCSCRIYALPQAPLAPVQQDTYLPFFISAVSAQPHRAHVKSPMNGCLRLALRIGGRNYTLIADANAAGSMWSCAGDSIGLAAS